MDKAVEIGLKLLRTLCGAYCLSMVAEPYPALDELPREAHSKVYAHRAYCPHILGLNAASAPDSTPYPFGDFSLSVYHSGKERALFILKIIGISIFKRADTVFIQL